MTMQQNIQPDGGEREFPELVSGLAELADRDRAAMPANLPDRIRLRTQSEIAGDREHAMTAKVTHRPRVLMRIAAAVLLLGSAGAIVLSLRQNAPTRQPIPMVDPSNQQAQAPGFDLDLVDGSLWNDSLDGEIDLLMAESTLLGGELDREWDDLDFLHDEGAL